MSIAQTDVATASRLETDGAWRLRLAEGGALLRLGLPIMMIALVNMGMSVTDTVMISWLFGADALASVAVGSDLYSIIFYLCAGTLGGIAPFYTAAATRGSAAERVRLERTGWIMAALLAMVAVPAVWSSTLWLAHFGLDPVLLADGEGYTRAIALTLIPMLGVTLYRTILTAAEKPKVFLKVTLVMLPLNGIGNYLLMLGWGPIPALGPTGAGVATLLVATGSLLTLVAIARRAPAGADAALGRGSWLHRQELAAVLRVGIPVGITTATETGIFLGATLYAATLGAADVAAHTLTLRMSGIAYAGSAAMLQAAMVRMARAESLGDAAARRAVVASSLTLSCILGVVLFLLLALGARPLADSFFDAGPAGLAAAQAAILPLILLGLMETGAYPCLAAAGLLRGLRDTQIPMVFMIIGYWIVGAPLGIYLCERHDLGATGIWIGLVTGMIVYAVLMLPRVFLLRR